MLPQEISDTVENIKNEMKFEIVIIIDKFKNILEYDRKYTVISTKKKIRILQDISEWQVFSSHVMEFQCENESDLNVLRCILDFTKHVTTEKIDRKVMLLDKEFFSRN